MAGGPDSADDRAYADNSMAMRQGPQAACGALIGLLAGENAGKRMVKVA